LRFIYYLDADGFAIPEPNNYAAMQEKNLTPISL
jgi:hypothetical protein